MYTFKLFSPKPNHKGRECEDAVPLCEIDKNERISIFGVFDGVGATGVIRHKIDADDKEHTSAYLGSNETRRFFETIYHEENFEKIFDYDVSEIESFIAERVFDDLLAYANNNRLFDNIRIKGKMFSLLPTTAAVAICRKNSDRKNVDVICIWAGDSRCYSFDSEGLHQLTKDDQNEELDAFESNTDQPPMCNAIQINKKKEEANKRNFHINCRKYTLAEPFLILCSTDGCYDYCGSPMHFEKAILNSIIESIKSEGSQDIETILKSNLNINADDCTLSAGFFSFNANVDEKALIYETFSERQKYLNRLIGNTSDLQKLVSEKEKIYKNIDKNNVLLEKYRKSFTDFMSVFPNRYDPNRSLDDLLKNGTIEKELPGPFEEYNAVISQNITLNEEISKIQKIYKEKLSEIWYKGGYKEDYERIYNNGVGSEKTAQNKSHPSDDDSGRKCGYSAQNNGELPEKTTTDKSNSSHTDSGNNIGGTSRNDGGKTEETTQKDSNSSDDNSSRKGGGGSTHNGGLQSETPPTKSNSTYENLGGNSGRSTYNNSEKPETSKTASSSHGETWTCQWCRHKIPTKDYTCPFCAHIRGSTPPPVKTWTCRECHTIVDVRIDPKKCPVCGADRDPCPANTWTCKRCGNTISTKDHPDVCPNCGLIKWSNQNPLKIIWNLFLSGFYKIRFIILKIANLIIKTESNKSNDDKGGY